MKARLTLVDSHCHLDLEQFEPDREVVVERARMAGVQFMVNPGIDLAQCRQAIALAERYPEVYLAIGIHPNSSADFHPAMLAELRELAAHPKVVAIGEIGLDYYWEKVDHAQQALAFRAQLGLAGELGLPVIIHSRESNADVGTILAEWVESDAFRHSPLAGGPGARPFAGVLHAFSGDLAQAQAAYRWNFVISLGGPVTFKNARALHALAPQLRQDRLMLETDAPYLTPHPHRGARNEPAYVVLVCEKLAELWGTTPAAVATASTRVAYQFFGLEDQFVSESEHINSAVLARSE